MRTKQDAKRTKDTKNQIWFSCPSVFFVPFVVAF